MNNLDLLPLNILFIASYYVPYMIGGAEKMLKIHAESLAQRGHHVTIATLGPQSGIVKESPVNGVDIIRMPVRNLFWPLETRKSYIQKISWHLIDCYNPMHFHEEGDSLFQSSCSTVRSRSVFSLRERNNVQERALLFKAMLRLQDSSSWLSDLQPLRKSFHLCLAFSTAIL